MDQCSKYLCRRNRCLDGKDDELSTTEHQLHQRVLRRLPHSLRDEWNAEYSSGSLEDSSSLGDFGISHQESNSNLIDQDSESYLDEFLSIHKIIASSSSTNQSRDHHSSERKNYTHCVNDSKR